MRVPKQQMTTPPKTLIRFNFRFDSINKLTKKISPLHTSNILIFEIEIFIITLIGRTKYVSIFPETIYIQKPEEPENNPFFIPKNNSTYAVKTIICLESQYGIL
jgi:hypothetical protein